MKGKVMVALSLVLALGTAGCSSVKEGKDTALKESGAQEICDSQIEEEKDLRVERNGFEEETNITCSIGNTEFSFPEYMKFIEERLVVEGIDQECDPVAVQFITEEQLGTGVKSYSAEQILGALFKTIGIPERNGVEDLSGEKMKIYKDSGSGTLNDEKMDCILYVMFNKETEELIVAVGLQSTDTEYNYIRDIDCSIQSARTKAAEKQEEDEIQESSADFRKAMDEYEAFMDQYIAFMQKYEKSDNVLGMMNEYLDYMQKYIAYVDSIEKIDEKELSEADALYYLEVTARVAKKLAGTLE